MVVRQESRNELTRALQEQYWRSDRAGKGRILDTFCEATKYHRKYAIALLKHGSVKSGPRRSQRRGRPPSYDARVIGGTAGCRRGCELDLRETTRSRPGDLVPAVAREGVLRIDDQVRAALLTLSPATIDRRLAADKRRPKQRGFGTTKPGTLLKSQIPIQTYLPWDDHVPWFVEIDLVAHSGAHRQPRQPPTLPQPNRLVNW
jgi:hypothetical protein